MKRFVLALSLVAASSRAQTPRVEAGVQVGALDEREALFEKPAIAGGRVTVRLYRFLDAEAEIDRFPIGNLGVAVAVYSRRHIFARFDFGDLIVSYGPATGYGTRHQFQGTAGFGLWF